MTRLLKSAAKVFLTLILLPVAVLAGLFSKGRKCSPEQLAEDLNQIAEGDSSSWDQLECIPIKNTQLEAIRVEAVMSVSLPLQNKDRENLKRLAARAAALQN